jgi:hypothetical protein
MKVEPGQVQNSMRNHTTEPDTELMSRAAGYTLRHKENEDILEELLTYLLTYGAEPFLRICQSKILRGNVYRGADKSLGFLISNFPICSTTKIIFLKWVKEVRTTNS